MGLVDGDKTDAHVAQFLLEEFGGQTFGRDVKQFYVAEDAVLEGDDDLFVGQTGIDGCRLDAPTQQIVNLILHQGDEWGDDDADTLHGEGRHLECNGLAATGRHQSQSVVTGTYRLDDLTLDAPEIIIAPVLLENTLIVQSSSLGLMSSICNCTSLRL